jgi:coenzyme F420 biosynthesis associated uncharacterized protein
MIDWIVAERIAGFVAGSGDAAAPTADLAALAAESETRVVAYTGLQPARPLPPPEGISRREWVTSNISSMRALLDPVLARAGKGLGPLRPAMEIGMGVVLSTEVGVVLGYLAQRVLGQYELVLLDEAVEDRPPRLLFVLPNLGQAVQAFGAEEKEFMTWVALHEVTHAVQFAGVPWLHAHVAGLVKELLQQAEVRIDTPRKLRMPTTDELRRVGRALKEGDLISILTSKAERETLDRVQAVMAVIEGHAEHVMDAVAPDLLPSLPKLRTALDQRRRSQKGQAVRARQDILRRRRHRPWPGSAPSGVLEPGGAADARRDRGPGRLDGPLRADRADRAGSALERVEVPLIGHAPQRVHAAVSEP